MAKTAKLNVGQTPEELQSPIEGLQQTVTSCKGSIGDTLLPAGKALQYFMAEAQRNSEIQAHKEIDGDREITDEEAQELLETIEQKYGIKVKKLGRAMDIWSKLNGGIPFNALGFGPFIGLRKLRYAKPSAVHESDHVLQYRDLCSLKGIGARVGFIKMGMEKSKKMKNPTKQREKYGKVYARNYKVDNAPMEREAYLHQNNPKHLDTREKFERRKYETKEGRSEAIMQSIDEDIKKGLEKIKDMLQSLAEKEDISEQDKIALNSLVEIIVKDGEKLVEIRNKYGKDDRELAVFRDRNEKLQVRAESETNRDKRFALTEKFLEKEKNLLSRLLEYKDTISLASTKEQLEYGIIQFKVKKGTPVDFLENILEKDNEIQELHPNMRIDKKTGYIRMNFTE